jgi:HEAT repeat protein
MGALGSAAVPDLVRVTAAGDVDAAQAAIAALVLTGSAEGIAALGEIAERHSDQSVRALAKIALGENVGHARD